MADRVRFILDKMAVLFQQLEQHQVFSEDEVKSIIKKRTDFEYMILRPELTISEYESYLQYELHLDSLREIRTKRLITEDTPKEEINQLRVIRSSFIQHIHYIYQRALRRFPETLHLWRSHISFLQEKESISLLDVTLGKAIALYPKNIEFWLKAASIEIESKANFHAARIFVQRGLRVNPRHPQLWAKYFDIELWNIMRILERRRILTATKNVEPVEEEWLAKLEKPLPVIFRHACHALLTKPPTTQSTRQDSSAPSSSSQAVREDHEEEVDEEEEEALLMSEEEVPAAHFEALFHMHYLALELCHLLASYNIHTAIEEHLLHSYPSFKHARRHLFRGRVIQTIRTVTLPLLSPHNTVTTQVTPEGDVKPKAKKSTKKQKKSEKEVETEEGTDGKEVVDETTVALLAVRNDLIEALREKISSEEVEGLSNEVTDMTSHLLTSLLPLFSERENSESEAEEERRRVAVTEFLQRVPLVTPFQLQPLLQPLHTSSLRSRRSEIVVEKVRASLLPQGGGGALTDVAQLTSSQGERLLANLHSKARVAILLKLLEGSDTDVTAKPVKSKKTAEIESADVGVVLAGLTAVVQRFEAFVTRIERGGGGVVEGWKSSLSLPAFRSNIYHFAAILQLLALHRSLFAERWRSWLSANAQRLQSVAPVLTITSETRGVLNEVLTWYDAAASSSVKEVQSDSDGDDEERKAGVGSWLTSWSAVTVDKVLRSVHLVQNDVREELLLGSVERFFASVKVEQWTQTLSEDVNSFFSHHWKLIETLPQLFSLQCATNFLVAFATSLIALVQEKDVDSLTHSASSVLRKRRKQASSSSSTLSGGDEVLLAVLRRLTEHWTRLRATGKTEEDNPFHTQLRLLQQAASNVATTSSFNASRAAKLQSLQNVHPHQTKKQRIVAM